MGTSYSNILLTREGDLAIITLNRPPANALSSGTIAELEAAFTELEGDSTVKAIIITGAGQYIFAAGADINEFTQLDAATGEHLLRRGQELFDRIERFPKPVIAAINGACLGGGNELAMACDLRVAAESARFGQPEINLGLLPGWGAMKRLPRLVGKGKALEMLLTGDMVKASDALRLGLVNRVVPDDELMLQAKNLARKLAGQAPLALARIKERLAAGPETDAEANAADTQAFIDLFSSEDGHEGVAAFLAKRRPVFKGR